MFEGTPDEIVERLRGLNGAAKLTLIIPGEEIAAISSLKPDGEDTLAMGQTFAEILSPLQEDFDASGMTDEELGELVDAELKASRAERRVRE